MVLLMMAETSLTICVVAASIARLTVGTELALCCFGGRPADTRIQLLPSSRRMLVLALALAVASGASGRGNIGAAAEGVV